MARCSLRVRGNRTTHWHTAAGVTTRRCVADKRFQCSGRVLDKTMHGNEKVLVLFVQMGLNYAPADQLLVAKVSSTNPKIQLQTIPTYTTVAIMIPNHYLIPNSPHVPHQSHFYHRQEGYRSLYACLFGILNLNAGSPSEKNFNILFIHCLFHIINCLARLIFFFFFVVSSPYACIDTI